MLAAANRIFVLTGDDVTRAEKHHRTALYRVAL